MSDAWPLSRATIERAREALMTRQAQEQKYARQWSAGRNEKFRDQQFHYWTDEAADTQRTIDAFSQLIAEGMYRDD